MSVAIAPDASGNFIYTANRDAGTISVYSVDPRAGLLTLTGGQVSAILPWALAADPSGKFLFVANGPGSVSTYAIGPNGALSFVAQTAQARNWPAISGWQSTPPESLFTALT